MTINWVLERYGKQEDEEFKVIFSYSKPSIQYDASLPLKGSP